MVEMATKYSQGFSSHEHTPSSCLAVPERPVYLVTGTTGALGAAVLAELVQSPEVGRIYAVNRRSGGLSSLMERQRSAFEKQGLDAQLLRSEKVQLVETDMAETNLGFTSALLDEVGCSLLVHP